MTSISTLATSLQSKMKNVPNITLEDCIDWVNTAVTLHGVDLAVYTKRDEVLALLLAQAEGARNVALNVSHYFSYQDGEDQVDKTKVADQYIKIANEFSRAYALQTSAGNGATTFYISTRVDR